MRRVIVPFTGGIKSLASLAWALQQNEMVPMLLYISNLRKTDEVNQLESVNAFVRNLRDFSFHGLYTINPQNKDYVIWNLSVCNEKLGNNDGDWKEYLAYQCVQYANKLNCKEVIWILDSGHEKYDRDVKFVTPPEKVKSPVYYISEWYYDTICQHEEQYEQDSSNDSYDSFDPTYPSRFIGNFDSDFNLLDTISKTCQYDNRTRKCLNGINSEMCDKCKMFRDLKEKIDCDFPFSPEEFPFKRARFC